MDIIRKRCEVPAHVGLEADGKEDGQWLYYEVAMTPFTNLDLAGDGAGNAIVDLDVNSIIGLDFVVESYDQSNTLDGHADSTITNARRIVSVLASVEIAQTRCCSCCSSCRTR